MVEQNSDALAIQADAFGRYLVQERELRGLSRDEVARATKIAPNVLEAIEAGDPKRMPAKGYLVGYLRSYAAAVGLDPDDVILRWHEVAPEDEAPPEKKPGKRAAAPGKALLWILVALVAAAGLTLLLRGGSAEPLRALKPHTVERGAYFKPGDPVQKAPGESSEPSAPAMDTKGKTAPAGVADPTPPSSGEPSAEPGGEPRGQPKAEPRAP
jgi:cytoskeletal protein RodZ